MENKYPQKTGIDTVLKTAFGYWSSTLKFQVIFSLLYLSILFMVYYFFASKYGIISQLEEASELISDFSAYNAELMKISKSQEWYHMTLIIIGTLVFLFPLNIGVFLIFRKLDLKEPLELSDLFIGYRGINFFKYISFYLFWFVIYTYTAPTVILGIIWVLITLFSAPLMFFMDKRFFETMELNFKVLKSNLLEILVCVLVGFLFKYSGILLCGVGFLLTFPFMNAIIYTLYQKYFKEVD
ncbi:hypothetical protein [Chryseobacterium sp.]|uniref:hypothetical protein n=1 Tax=Chryseobacterium sp. TaxID=1871047 RepID=UPI0011C79E19|nr:hypothetical protein [Chryseobacterium sp.]TXF75947.1 hypothetical protein FUA25_08575 [Chryseobacterium sp.]